MAPAPIGRECIRKKKMRAHSAILTFETNVDNRICGRTEFGLLNEPKRLRMCA